MPTRSTASTGTSPIISRRGQDRHRRLRRDPGGDEEAGQGGARPPGAASARAAVRARAARRRHPAHDLAHPRRDPQQRRRCSTSTCPSPMRACCEIAEKIIAQQEAKFDPTQFKDRYEDALRELIERKKKGKPVDRRGARGEGREGRRPDGGAEEQPQGRRRPRARRPSASWRPKSPTRHIRHKSGSPRASAPPDRMRRDAPPPHPPWPCRRHQARPLPRPCRARADADRARPGRSGCPAHRPAMAAGRRLHEWSAALHRHRRPDRGGLRCAVPRSWTA